MDNLEDLSKSLVLVNPNRIIVGIDYGTTSTGVSYVSATNKDLNDIVVVNTWPGPARDARAVFKAPSRIAYPSENAKISSLKWGFQVEPGMTAYSWTKLLFDKHTPLTGYDDKNLESASGARIMRLPPGKTAVQVAGDYLTEIYRHVLKLLARQITEDELSVTPLEFWLTVPAIWSDQAKSATRDAALYAGFGGTTSRPDDRILMITEPEAAAIAAMKKSTEYGLGGGVKPGEGVLVCDCGGGTVDITAYLIAGIYPHLEFDELCTGIGGKCGSTAVDRNFYELMSERFGAAFDNLPPKRKGPGSDFMKKFEQVKSDFGVYAEDEVHELPLNMALNDPDPRFYDEDELQVKLSNDDLRGLFDPVIEHIIGLIRTQIEDASREAQSEVINRIILVGGFGDSEYLRQALLKHFGANGKITITVPDNPQTAIVRGAAIRGLAGVRPRSRRIRRHYGFDRRIPFREGIDVEKDAFYDVFTKRKLVSNMMKWMIAKGERYTENYTCRHSVGLVHYEGDSLQKHINLHSCDLTDAPNRVGTGIQHVGIIRMNFMDVDLTQFEKKTVNGKHLYLLKYDVEVIFGAEEGVLKFQAISKGMVIGKTDLSFSERSYR